MARVLAYTSPAKSHLFSLTAILDELHRRGHEIALRTLSSHVELMREHGFDAAPIGAQVEAIETDDWRVSNPRQSVRRSARAFAARAEHDGPDLQRAIAESSPDALIVDINSWGGLIAAEEWGGPWAALCPFPLPLRSDDAPPFGPGLPPARGVPGRIRDRVLRPLVVGMVEREMRPALNTIRERMGVAPLATVEELLDRPPLLLYTTAEPFEYPRRDWPENLVMTGPCEWEPASEAPPWLEHTEEPIVLVNTSSVFQDDGRLVQVALEALADEPVRVVATMPAGEPADFQPPANARVERFVPHGPLLERAICAVTHGGMGSTQKALARGVPVCVVPFGRDQLEVARRVDVARAGTRLPAARLRADRLRDKIQQAIARREGAQRIAAAFAAAGGASAAADAVEDRLL
jgi:MGT family glycosyltransferase